MLFQSNPRRSFLLLLPTCLIVFFLFSFLSIHAGLYHNVVTHFDSPTSSPTSRSAIASELEPTPLPSASPTTPPRPRYKTASESHPLVKDTFPLAAAASSPTDIPPIPEWNTPPNPHVSEKTPLFIGFTRNWLLLQQTVVSYITAGWPPSDIYVVDNTGTMFSNRNQLLTLQNPFFLDYHRLTSIFGVNVIFTPTLLTFAQLQNFYLYTALESEWDYYFWSHMDIVALSVEDFEPKESYQSLYMRAVGVLRETLLPDYGRWAIRWFSYDRLSLVNTQAFVDIGGWDVFVPYYMTDCDMHERLWMRGFSIESADVGAVYDVGASLDDLKDLYRVVGRDELGLPRSVKSPSENLSSEGVNSPAYHALVHNLEELQRAKSDNPGSRLSWQARQQGGQGAPFYRDAEGFQTAMTMTMDFGRTVFDEKWGHRGCDIRDVGLKEEDAWRVIGEWEVVEDESVEAETDQKVE